MQKENNGISPYWAFAEQLYRHRLSLFWLFFYSLFWVLPCHAAEEEIFKYGGENHALTAQMRTQSAVKHSTSIPATPDGPLTPSTVYTASPSLAPGAITVRNPQENIATDLDDYDSEPISVIADPIEPWNRFWFRFNDIFYMHVAKPVYKGWTYVTPQFFRNGLSNLFYNVLFPTRFINSILQFRLLEAGVEFSRFMMNIMGSAGLANLAKNKKTIVPVDPSGEDFGQTLGRWGFGPGFYIVWPFIGPSSLRDSFGRVGDYFTDPIFYLNPWTVSTGTEGVFRLNELGDVLPSYEDLRNISIDPYIGMREAYATMRAGQIQR